MLAARRAAMAWRIRSWGYAALTPREYEAVSIEGQLRREARGLSRLRLYALEDHLHYATGAPALAEAHVAMYEEIQALQGMERGIQSEVARLMETSKQHVSKLLGRASLAMAYLADVDMGYGWRRGVDGGWYLAVPVAPIDGSSRRKIRDPRGIWLSKGHCLLL